MQGYMQSVSHARKPSVAATPCAVATPATVQSAVCYTQGGREVLLDLQLTDVSNLYRKILLGCILSKAGSLAPMLALHLVQQQVGLQALRAAWAGP
jgi:hypothetical protein